MSVSVIEGVDCWLSPVVLSLISSSLSSSARGVKGLLLSLSGEGGELMVCPIAVIALYDLDRAERSGVGLLFCFFCLEKLVMDICVFWGDTNVRFLANPVASFIILLLALAFL